MNEEISIVVPVYQSEVYLYQCIDSLINQTYKNLKIILVNDGSMDNSGNICDYYARIDKRVKVIHQQNMGAAAAVNNGLDASTSDYIMFVDADDWIELNTCEVALKSSHKFNSDIVFWLRINEYEHASIQSKPLFANNTVFEDKKIIDLRRRLVGLVGNELRNPILTDALSSVWGKLYKRQIIVKNKIRFVDTAEIGSTDVLFVIQVFKFTRTAVFISEYLSHYRKYNPNSLTANYSFTLFRKYLKLFENINLTIDSFRFGSNYKIAFGNRIALSTINNILSITHPRYNNSLSFRIKEVRRMLNEPVYINAYSRFQFEFLPIHWKIFFIFCKLKFSYGVYFFGVLMNKLR